MDWPVWWTWELEFSAHLFKRMHDRDFNEVDVRAMLHDASGFRPDYQAGRWIVETRLEHNEWEVVVEPIETELVLLVITAYPSR